MRTLLTSRAFRLAMAASTVVLSVLLAQAATAQQCCDKPAACAGGADQCGRCGLKGPCKMGCKMVCEMKEEKKVVWVVKCEAMCTTLPGCPLGQRACCQAGCGECAAGCGKSGESCEKNGCACLVLPKCGRERSVRKLEKKEIVCQKPVYKCVPSYCCDGCYDKGQQEATTLKTAPAAPAPATAPAPTPKAPKAPKPTAPKSQALQALPKLTMEETPWPSLAHAD